MSSSKRGWRLLPCSVLAIGLLVSAGAGAQKVNSSPNFVGSGARALGMGGAFIAVADDATAASWNPGGLTQLERPELSIVYSWKWFNEKFADTRFVTPNGTYDVNLDDLNYLSFVYPIPWTLSGRNFVLSLNFQRKYDFDRSLAFRGQTSNVRNPAAPWTHWSGYIDFQQKGSLATLSPAAGIELTDRLSIGMAVNIWDSSLIGDNEWESVTQRRTIVSGVIRGVGGGLIPFTGAGTHNTYEKYENIEGINYTFGALYKATDRLSFGAVYHTAYSTDVDYTQVDEFRGTVFGRNEFRTKLRIDWPASMGFGVAYRFPKDKLTMTFDITRRNWNSFVQIYPDGPIQVRGTGPGIPAALAGARVSPLTNLDKRISPADPTYTLRLGGEYVFFNPDKPRQKFLPSVRAGIFWDPEPASGRHDTPNGVAAANGESDNYYGFALGLGVLMYNRVNIDLAYEYRRGDNVRRDTLVGTALEPGFHEDVNQHLLYLSTVIYF